MAVAADALTTLTAVCEELKITSPDADTTSFLERAINGASARVVSHCGRSFHRVDGIEEKVKGFGSPRIRLARTPILTVTSIVIDGTTIDDDDFHIEDAAPGDALGPRSISKPGGFPWTAERGPGISQSPVPGTEDSSRIVVTYDGGFVTPTQAAAGGAFEGEDRTLPWDLEEAVIKLVATRWRSKGRDLSVVAQSSEASGFTFDGRLPPDVVALLAPFTRFAHA